MKIKIVILNMVVLKAKILLYKCMVKVKRFIEEVETV
jgi:hypothetical protein